MRPLTRCLCRHTPFDLLLRHLEAWRFLPHCAHGQRHFLMDVSGVACEPDDRHFATAIGGCGKSFVRLLPAAPRIALPQPANLKGAARGISS